MKPIFEEERDFLSELLKIDIPTECWRKAHAIYLDMDLKDPIIRFKVDNGEAMITKDNRSQFENYKQKGFDYHITSNLDNISNLVEKSQEFIKNYILSNPGVHQYVLGYSSGKDSIVNVTMWLETLKKYPEIQIFLDKHNIKWEIQMANTSNDTPDTYKNIKNTLPAFLNRYGYGVALKGYSGLDLIYEKEIYSGDCMVDVTILNPEVGFYQWIIEEKDYFVPTVMVRNCCSTYKEGQTDKFYPKDKKVVIVSGVRKYESFKRAKYDYIMDDEFKLKLFKRNNFPKMWIQLAPIVEWYNEDIWLFLLGNPNIPFNPMYRLGFHRVG